MLTLSSNQLPPDLKQLAHPVKKLHIVGGDLMSLLKLPRIAVVGTRKATPYGRGVTQQLVTELVQRGVVIVSGLALGTDSIAHQTCLDAGGKTIAVMACGPDRVYPSSNTNLGQRIIENNGVLITEYEPGHKPFAHNFLERNRIIAGLSDAVLIPEAAIRSGSLNTANHALQLGKPVFAIPGNITNPLSAGCNNLIKAGAIPVTCIEDILNELGWEDLNGAPRRSEGSTPEEQMIVDLIQSGHSDGADLLALSGLEPSVFNQALTMLEITDTIRPTGANHWSV